MNLKIDIKKVREDATLPTYAHEGDACMDCYAAENIEVKHGGKAYKIPLGFAVNVPEGWEMQVRSRSGLALNNGIAILNSPGTIDSGYKDEVCAILYNISDKNTFFKKGARVCQICFHPIHKIEWNEVQELTGIDRGGGFGSSGI